MGMVVLQKKDKVLDRILENFYELFKTPNNERKEPMLNLVLPFVANMLRDFVIDEATNFGKKELEKHLDKLPQDVREAIDSAVDGDNSHAHKKLLDMVK
jgi:uncharacterized protein YheU (UPF0270 family)